MGAWAVLLVLFSAWAIIGGNGAKRKLLNLVIILAFMAGGIGIGFALGTWGGNAAIGEHAAASLMILLGCVGALGCARRNKMRAKDGRRPADKADGP